MGPEREFAAKLVANAVADVETESVAFGISVQIWLAIYLVEGHVKVFIVLDGDTDACIVDLHAYFACRQHFATHVYLRVGLGELEGITEHVEEHL